jgi:hypothetical protein
MANMTRAEMETEVLARLGETSGFFALTEIDQWLYDAVDDIAVQVEPLVATATADVVASQAEYGLPTDTINVKQVHYGGSGSWVTLEETTYESLFRDVLDWEDSTVTGGATTPPTSWYWRSNTIGLYPKPTSALASGLRMLYSYRPARMSGSTASSGYPEWFDRPIVTYAVWKCRLKDRDEKRAQFMWAEYQRLLGQVSRTFNKPRKEQGPRLVPRETNYRQYYSRPYPVETIRINTT